MSTDPTSKLHIFEIFLFIFQHVNNFQDTTVCIVGCRALQMMYSNLSVVLCKIVIICMIVTVEEGWCVPGTL